MNKCFITKLPSSIDNDNLPVLGQLRINWLKQNDLTDNAARAICLKTSDSITVNVSGAHFTDNTLTSNLGNTKTINAADGAIWLYVSNDSDAVLNINNKYSLTLLSFVYPNKDDLDRSVYFDIEDIKYCTNLTNLNLRNAKVSGDISALSKLTSLSALTLTGNNISGNISVLSKLTNITTMHLDKTLINGDISELSAFNNLITLNIKNTQIGGDISTVSKFTNLTTLYASNSQISGDISALSKLTSLSALTLANTNVVGDIDAISNLTKLNSLSLSNTQIRGKVDSLAKLTSITNLYSLTGMSLTGDMSKIPANVYLISQYNRKDYTNFTWTANGRKNVTLLAMDGYIPFDTASMDNMFIDQATCTFKPNASLQNTYTIQVKGTRTSASDAAVAAIQNMGVTIAGVTKES